MRVVQLLRQDAAAAAVSTVQPRAGYGNIGDGFKLYPTVSKTVRRRMASSVEMAHADAHAAGTATRS